MPPLSLSGHVSSWSQTGPRPSRMNWTSSAPLVNWKTSMSASCRYKVQEIVCLCVCPRTFNVMSLHGIMCCWLRNMEDVRNPSPTYLSLCCSHPAVIPSVHSLHSSKCQFLPPYLNIWLFMDQLLSKQHLLDGLIRTEVHGLKWRETHASTHTPFSAPVNLTN